MFVAQDIERAGLDDEVASRVRGESQPSGDEDAQNMAVGKDEGIILNRHQAGDHAVAAIRHLIRGFTARGGSIKNSPTGSFLANLLGGDSFVVPVVPLGEFIRDLRPFRETSQFASAPCSLSRTAENKFEIPVGQFRFEFSSLAFAFWRQWDVTEGCMLAVFTPLGFTVTDEDDLGA